MVKVGITSVLVAACVVAGGIRASYAANYTIGTLATFTGSNGNKPQSDLIVDGSGNFYGTTWVGGAIGAGSVFEVAAGSHALSAIASFNVTNGANPYTGSLYMDGSGNLLGATNWGGANSDGLVYQVATGTHNLSTVLQFNGSGNGAEPIGGLVADKNGNLYGTTWLGGANGVGTVYELAAVTHAYSLVATFSNTNGAHPQGGLIVDGSGNLFGTTYYGGDLTGNSGQGFGTVFEVAAGSRSVTTLATFEGANGSGPCGSLLADKNGNLYGTTAAGGANGVGSVYMVASVGHALTTLTSFDGTHGSGPNAGVIADSNGNLYGTTVNGGAFGYGAVYEVAVGSHALTTMASFNNTNGANPYGALIADGGGNLYGTTSAGGSSGEGTVFEVFGGNATGPAALFNGSVATYPQANVIGTSDGGHLASLTVVWVVPAGGDAGGGGGYYASPVVDLNTTLASANRGSVGIAGDIAAATTRPKFVMLWVDSADEAAIYAKLATLLGSNGLLAVEDAGHQGNQWLALTGQVPGILGYKDGNSSDADAYGKTFSILLQYSNSSALTNFSWDFSSLGGTAVVEAIAVVPEPGTVGLVMVGVLGLVGLVGRRRRAV